MIGYYDNGMMFEGFGIAMMIFFVILIVLAIVLIVMAARKTSGKDHRPPLQPPADAPMDRLRMRYVNGEINKEEYEEMLGTLIK